MIFQMLKYMINKESTAKQITAHIGIHGLVGTGIGLIEAIVLGGMNSREGRARNYAKVSLLLGSSAMLMAGIQVLVAKYGDIEEHEKLDYVNKWVVPGLFILPSVIIQRSGASRATQAIEMQIRNGDQHVKALAIAAQEKRPTIIWFQNFVDGGGKIPEKLKPKERVAIGAINYSLMVGITHLVHKFTN